MVIWTRKGSERQWVTKSHPMVTTEYLTDIVVLYEATGLGEYQIFFQHN